MGSDIEVELSLAGENVKSLVNALSGSLGGFISSAVLFPMDVLKTRLQAGQGWKEITAIAQKSEFGYAAFWSGAHVRGTQSSIEKFIYFYWFEALMQMYKRDGDKPGTLMTLIIGYVSDFFTACIAFPIDNVVNRSIKSGQPWYDVARRLSASEHKIGALYAGFGPRLVAGIKPAIQFTIYEQIRPIFLKRAKGNTLTFAQSFFLGALCRAIADIIMYPARTLKVRHQSDSENKTFMDVVKNEGVGALYKGLGLEVTRGVFSAGMMLMVKEQVYNLVAAVVLKNLGKGTSRKTTN